MTFDEAACVDKHYRHLSMSLEALQEWFLCLSRRKARAAVMHPCQFCDGEHPYAQDYLEDPNGYWTYQRQYDLLYKWQKSVAAGHTPTVNGREWLYDWEADAHFKGVIAFDEESGLTRGQLLHWYACSRKKTYAHLTDAVASAAKHSIMAYPCQHDGETVYHIGHPPKSLEVNRDTFKHARDAFLTYMKAGKAVYGSTERVE